MAQEYMEDPPEPEFEDSQDQFLKKSKKFLSYWLSE